MGREERKTSTDGRIMGYSLFCGSPVTLKCEWLQQTLFEAKKVMKDILTQICGISFHGII